jgi:HlyD family secretion protein
MTRFRTAVLYIGAIAVTVPTLISGCANSGTPSVNAAAQTSQPPVAVQSTHPSLRDIARVISLPGEATAWQEATLYAKVPGYVESIIVDKGDRVRAGQVVATLRAPELEADRQQAHLSSLSAEEAARVSEAMGRKSDAEVARAQLTQAESVEKRSEEQRVLAESSVDESRTQFQKAQADLDAAQSEQKLANITLERYPGIYTKDNRLIARQQVDEAQSRADVASEKVNAAEGQLQAARARVKSAESQVRVAQHQIEEAKAGITAARDQVSVATAQQASARKQVDLAKTDVAISRSQGLVNQAQASQARLQAAVQRSAESRTGTLAAYATIRAPFSGIVTKRLADVGAFIQTAATSQNAAAVATVADIDRIRIYYHVPE